MLVSVCLSLASHRFGLPLTFRSCFYPMLGNYTWGWIGDLIDGLAIVVSISGITVNLGLGSDLVSNALTFMGWVVRDGTEAQVMSIQQTVVWIISVMSAASVISGLQSGIRMLSVGAVVLALFLLCLVALMDDTKYIFNLVTQECGYFLQTSIFQLNFWTDAFGQLREGSGRAVDGKAAEQWWADAWLVFYQVR
jgi:choline-glycine betaine transporter